MAKIDMYAERKRILSLSWATLFLSAATAQYTRQADRGGDVSGNPYCAPTFFNDGSAEHYINGVTIGGIAWTNTGFSGTNGYNDDFFDGFGTVTSLAPGGTYVLAITTGTAPDSHYYAWLDEDADGQFEGGELIGHVQGTGSGVQVTLTLDVPVTPPIGYTGLRVLCVSDLQPNPDPCGGYGYGEAEDYAVLLADQSPCMPTHNQGTSDGDFIAAIQVGPNSGTAGYQGLYPYTLPNGAFHLEAGQLYDLTITSGTYPTDRYKTWVDWNADGDWDDAGEQVGEFVSTGANVAITEALTVPDSAWGWFTLRIRCADNVVLTPCDDQGYGETRDLMIVVDNPARPCLTYNYTGSTTGLGLASINVNGSSADVPHGHPNHFILPLDPVARAEQGGAFYVNATGMLSNAGNLVVCYIDLNNDLDFDDPNETSDHVLGTQAGEVMNFTIAVPLGTAVGGHWLRIASYGEGFEFVDGCRDPAAGQVVDVYVMVDSPTGPCIPGNTDWTLEGDFIDGVQLGDIQNLGSGGTYGPVYTDHPQSSTDLIVTHDYELLLTSGIYGTDNYHAWIDYNDDQDFDEADEFLGTAASTAGYQTLSIPFTVPTGTALGEKRLRVRCVWNEGPDACADAGFGETEDYTVNIIASTAISENDDAGWSVQVVNGACEILMNEPGRTFDGATATLVDASGRVVGRGRMEQGRIQIRTGHLSLGIYWIRVFIVDDQIMLRVNLSE